ERGSFQVRAERNRVAGSESAMLPIGTGEAPQDGAGCLLVSRGFGRFGETQEEPGGRGVLVEERQPDGEIAGSCVADVIKASRWCPVLLHYVLGQLLRLLDEYSFARNLSCVEKGLPGGDAV